MEGEEEAVTEIEREGRRGRGSDRDREGSDRGREGEVEGKKD
jgi:hypothetical protein